MLKQLFNALKCNIQFTNPFSSSFEDNELYFLSFGVPAKLA